MVRDRASITIAMVRDRANVTIAMVRDREDVTIAMRQEVVYLPSHGATANGER